MTHAVARVRVGALFDNVRALQQKGDTAILGETESE